MENETIGQRIRAQRKALRLSQEKLGSRIGVAGGAISQWEGDKTRPIGENLMRLAAELRLSPDFILTGKNASTTVTPSGIDSSTAPLITYMQSKSWGKDSSYRELDGGINFIQTNIDLSRSAFALAIKGRGMEPEFSEGDVVFIDPLVTALPGDFVLAEIEDNEVLFLKYRPRGKDVNGDVFELSPLNDDYAKYRSDTSKIRIIGVMVEHRRYRTTS